MVRSTTLVVCGVICLVISIGVGWIGFPKLLTSKINEAKQLRKGSQMRKDWTNIPIDLDFKIYIFNVTNPDEVQAGGKPTVQEIGPYFYRERKGKVNLEDDPEEDTITYQMINSWFFDEDETKPLTGDEIIVIPHALILVFAQVTLEQKASALNMVNKAIPHIFNNPQNIFLTTTAREFLFDGVVLNCTKAKEFAANTLCDQIRKKPEGLKAKDDGTFLFSIFGARNGTPDTNTLTVKRGMKNIQEVGQVVLYNGKPEMSYWSGMPCNQIKGSDTTMFPPFLEKKDIWSFGAEVCRSLAARYIEPRDYKGIHGYYYDADLGDMSTDPDLKCFCPTNDTCLKKGAFDTSKCTGAPFILTLPHCYLCDPEYINSVNGLNPSEEKHNIFSIFEPITGSPVSGHRRMQFNMWLFRISKIEIMKTLTENKVLVPLFWLDEGVDLNDTLCKTIRNMLYRPVKIVHISRWILLGLGIGLIAYAIFIYYKSSNLNTGEPSKEDAKTTITQVSPAY